MKIFNLKATCTSADATTAGPLGGYVALGTDGKKLVVFSELTKQVYHLRASDLKEMELKAKFGAIWCEANYTSFDPKKEVEFFDYKALATNIIAECQAVGPYRDAIERQAGVWKLEDGRLIVNGEMLFCSDGQMLEHGIYEGRVYPRCGDIGFNLYSSSATDTEVNDVLAAFAAPRWTHPMAAELVLGFVGLAISSTALRRRPHVLLTGPAGCGKSSVLEQVRWLLGNFAHACTGPQTLAGLYQSLSGKCKVVVNDEFEADPTRRACKETFEIARMSYSMQEGDDGIVRGTVSGEPRKYHFYSPFIAAGISPGKMEPADLTRWVVLESKGKPVGCKLDEAQARQIGPRLARLFVSRWNLFQANECALRERVIANGGDDRMADTVGSLLASYWTFVSNEPATASDADTLLEMFGMRERIAVHQVSDEQQCLEVLMSRIVSFKVTDGVALVNRKLSIAQAIQKVCEDPTGQSEIVTNLAQLGLRVAVVRGKWQLFVVNSPVHVQLRRLFGGTKWSTGGWSVVLRRLPGGEESTQRLGAGVGVAKVTVIDVPEHLLPGSVDGEVELMAA